MTFVFVKGSTILGTGETIAEVAQACGTALRPLVYRIEGPWRPEAFYLRDGRLRLHPGAEGWILPYGRYTPELRDDHPPLSGASLRALETIATRSRILGTEVHHATAEVLLRAGLVAKASIEPPPRALLYATPAGHQYLHRVRQGLR